MMDEAKVVIALGFFGSVTYVIRLLVLHASGALTRRGAPEVLPVISEDRFARLEQAVDAISLEIERISEGQRFTTKLLADRAQSERADQGRINESRQITPH